MPPIYQMFHDDRTSGVAFLFDAFLIFDIEIVGP
jgi:hypothetical protein